MARSFSGYFYLGFDHCNRLTELLCLTRDKTAASRFGNFYQLHGIHISYLNNLAEKFRDDEMKDLFDFFAEPWAAALLNQSIRVGGMFVCMIVCSYVCLCEPR